MKNQKLKIAIDNESVNIYREVKNNEPIHICYWHEDEWIEDAESVVPAIIKAIELFYTDQIELLKKLGLNHLIL